MPKCFFSFMLGLGWAAGVGAADCVHSPWGAEDQIGAANRVTPERTLAAASLVRKGVSHEIGRAHV